MYSYNIITSHACLGCVISISASMCLVNDRLLYVGTRLHN